MIFKLLLIVALFIPISVKAESLFESSDTMDVELLLKKADELRSKDPQQFNIFIDKLSEYQGHFTPIQEDYLEYLKGYQLGFKADFNQAQEIWKRLSILGNSEEIRFRANLSLINIYAYTKQWSEGLKFLEQNLENLHLIKNSEISQLGISAAAIFYNQLGQYELGLKYAEQLDSLNLNGRNLCIAKHQIVESKFHLSKLNIDSIEFSNALSVCDLDNEPVWLSAIYIFKAKILKDKEEYEKVIKLLESHRVEIERINYVPSISLFYSLLAESYFKEKNNFKAREFSLKTLELTKGVQNSEPQMRAYEILYQLEIIDDDYKSALEYYIKFSEADKAFLDDLKTKYLAFQLAQHKAVEQKVQIELLNKQNKLLKASQRLADSETENNRLFMALLIMVISLLAIAAIRSNRNQKRLRHLAEYDSLTQIYNRGHFTSAAQDAMLACQTNQDDISCILFDLDKFKTINDEYGHACGDWVLKTVASTCKSIGRKNDIFARLGGEEFCIILSRCDANTAMKIAEDYRKAIETIDSAPSGNTFPITASFGVTDSRQSGYSLEALTGHADNAMYLAKDTGRNKVCTYRDVVAADDSNSVII